AFPRPAGPLPAAHVCQFEVHANGSTSIVVDGGKRLTLPETLGNFALILVADDGGAPDGMVAWKSVSRIADLLQQRMNRPFNPHAISNLQSRLRSLFDKAGMDRRLIQSDAERGARLRLKRQPPTLPA